MSIRVPRGHRSIGWSAVGAAVEAERASRYFHFAQNGYVFDPKSHHCYRVDATVYGHATADEHRCGELRACPPGTRERYWNCLVGASEAGVERCQEEARRACAEDEE